MAQEVHFQMRVNGFSGVLDVGELLVVKFVVCEGLDGRPGEELVVYDVCKGFWGCGIRRLVDGD